MHCFSSSRDRRCSHWQHKQSEQHCFINHDIELSPARPNHAMNYALWPERPQTLFIPRFIDAHGIPRLVDALGRRHGSLDGQATNVLPALLEQGDQVVDGQHDVGDQLVRSHADVADGDTHAQNLLELELDGRLDLGNLGAEVVGVRDGSRELASYWTVSLLRPAGGCGESD